MLNERNSLGHVVRRVRVQYYFENRFSILQDSDSLSNNFSWSNQILNYLLVNSLLSSAKRNLLVVVRFLWNHSSLGNNKEIDVFLLANFVAEFSNYIKVMFIKYIRNIDDSSLNILFVLFVLESVLIGLSDFNVAEFGFVSLRFVLQLREIFIYFMSNQFLLCHSFRFIKIFNNYKFNNIFELIILICNLLILFLFSHLLK